MANLQKIREEIENYLSITEDVDGETKTRGYLAWNNTPYLHRTLGECAVYLSNKGYRDLLLEEFLTIFHNVLGKNRTPERK